MAEVVGRSLWHWLVLVGLSFTSLGLFALGADARGSEVRFDAGVESDRGVLLIEGAGPGASVTDPPGPSLVVRLPRPPSGRPIVAEDELSRWLEQIVVVDRGVQLRTRPDVVVRRLISKVGTIALELRSRPVRPPVGPTPVRRQGEGQQIGRAALAVEPAAGPTASAPAAASNPTVSIVGPAAVFEREGVLWIASPSGRAPPAPEPASGLEVLETAAGDGGSALRLRLTGLVPVIHHKGRNVLVEIRPGEAALPKPVPHVGAAGAATFQLHDPDVGDLVDVELASIPHREAPIAWSAPGLELFPSWLGRAARRTVEVASAAAASSAPEPAVPLPPPHRPSAHPVEDDGEPVELAEQSAPAASGPLGAKSHAQDTEPSTRGTDPHHAPQALPSLSVRKITSDRAAATEAQPKGDATALTLVSSAPLDEAGRAAARRRALAAVAADPAAPAPRLELAQLLLADAMATEASVVLAPRQPGQAPVAAPMLRAAIAALSARMDEAARLLGQQAEGTETALWLAFVSAARDEPDNCVEHWQRSREVLWRYPEPLRRRLAVPVAACILDAGRVDLTLAILDRLEPSLHAASAKEHAAVAHLRGSALSRDRRWPEARRALDAAIERGDPIIRTRAAFDRVAMAYEAGQMPADAAYAELARQAAAWRGHGDEPLMLDRLARMAAQAGRPAQALATWRKALDRAPNHPALNGTMEAMREELAAALRDVEKRGVEGGHELGAGQEAGAIAALALAMSWRKLPWTEEIRALALDVADLAADQGTPRAALSLGGTSAVPAVRARWQLLAGDSASALETLRAAPEASTGAQAALAEGRLDEALALLRSPGADAREEATGSTIARPDVSGGIRVEEEVPPQPPAPHVNADASAGDASDAGEMPPDFRLVKAAAALAAIEGPAASVDTKLAAGLEVLRWALEERTEH